MTQIVKVIEPLSPVQASAPAQTTKAVTLASPIPIGSQPTGLVDYVVANPVVAASFIAGSIALVVGLLTVGGVVLSLIYAYKRMKAELSAAEMRGFRDREHSRAEGNADRQHASDEA